MQKLVLTIAIMAVLVACQKSGQAQQSAPQTDTVAQRTLPASVTIAMTGDIMLGNTFPHDRLPADSGKHLFDHVSAILQSADVACGNLEGTMAERNVGTPRKNMSSRMAFMFKMPPSYVKNLVDAGYDFLGIANNHIYDFYGDAMNATEATLKSAGLGVAGANDPQGKTAHDRCSVKEIKGVKYGFAAFCHEDYTLRLQDTALVRSIINELRAQVDVVMICFHGGAEGSVARHLPDAAEYFCGDHRGYLREFTHFCIDAGADVVFGAGPHVVRGIELYKGHFIAYSLGNFCTCGMGIAGLTGVAPCITIDVNPENGKFLRGKIHAFRQQYFQGPRRDASGEAIKEIRTLTREDFKQQHLQIADDGAITLASNK